MGEFTLPANIKQIGSIGEGLRIYMEDYVFTYLNQFAEAGGYDERIAYLIGRKMVIDAQSILFINGAVQGKEAVEKDGLLAFTEQSEAYADAMREKYFNGLEVVGWMQSQPSYGLYLNQRYAAYHKKYFPGENCVMFVMDPMERLNTFYIQEPERNVMTEIRGYFIYYDKNAGMHEYMLDDKQADFSFPKPALIEMETPQTPDQPPFWKTNEPVKPEEVIRRHQEGRTQRRSALKHKRSMNMLAGLSAVLFIVCFVMGAGLIQNQDRISIMEAQLVQLSTAYRNLYTQLSDNAYSPAFAEQESANSGPPDIQTIPDYEEEPAPPGHEPITEPETEPAVVIEEPIITTTAATEVSAIPETYTIQPGDSLIAICLRFYGDDSALTDILVLNGIENADHIQAGKTIALPKR